MPRTEHFSGVLGGRQAQRVILGRRRLRYGSDKPLSFELIRFLIVFSEYLEFIPFLS